MLNVMISKGLKGRTNLEEYHEVCMRVLKEYMFYKGYIHEYANPSNSSCEKFITTGELINFVHVKDFDYANNKHRLKSFKNNAMEELVLADIAVFFDDYDKFSVCRIEHQICLEYGIPIVYLNSGIY